MKNWHKIITGDSRRMKEVLDESVHLVITSPPYWQLKDYGEGNQIGFDDSYEDYINSLNLVWKECHRVLNNGCRLCVNIGDQFARSVYYGRYKVIPIRTEIIKFCETIGFDYMGAIIWQKVTTTNTTGGATIMGSFPYPRNGILKLDYEFILIFKKYGTAPGVSREVKKRSKLTKEEWNQYFAGHWNFPGEKQRTHLAMFPEELPRRLIKMYSFVGDTVLDPFLGSGTTSLAARKLRRNSWGYEINESFIPLMRDKVSSDSGDSPINDELEITRQEKVDFDIRHEIGELPYTFRDPVKFDRKKDPKKFKFGSKVDQGIDYKREKYYRVKQIVSSECVILNNDQKIRLIGIKENSALKEKAMKFLSEKTKGQKVFIKFDVKKYDADNNLFCYLYLKNRTFLNSHLIKSGLVDVDENRVQGEGRMAQRNKK
jgi:site-specific DNA-methyltransferase (adenine-specific)